MIEDAAAPQESFVHRLPPGNGRKPEQQSPLEAFLQAIERLTGLQICIYDLNFFLNESPNLTVPTRLRNHSSPFCNFVKTNPEAYAKCIKTENWRTAKAATANGPLLHTCHAGVTDLIMPVRAGGRQVGAAFLGQAFTGNARQIQERLRKLQEEYDYREEDLGKVAKGVPRISASELRKLQALLMAITDYLEKAEQLAAVQGERDYWSHCQQAFDSLPEGKINLGQLPTPALDRIRGAIEAEEDSRIWKAMDLIRGSYWKAPSCQEIARAAGMSQSHFSREFHRVTGMTYRQCLLECRLNAAFYLLKRYRLTIEEAAVVVGYGDGCALQRAFKTFMGMTPHQFLRRYPRAFMLEKFE